MQTLFGSLEQELSTLWAKIKTTAKITELNYYMYALSLTPMYQPVIVQSFYGKKSVNLPLIATEGFSTVLDSAMYF